MVQHLALWIPMVVNLKLVDQLVQLLEHQLELKMVHMLARCLAWRKWMVVDSLLVKHLVHEKADQKVNQMVQYLVEYLVDQTRLVQN